LKNNLFSKISLFFSLLIICFVSIETRTQAAQSGNDFTTGSVSSLYMRADEEVWQPEKAGVGNHGMTARVPITTPRMNVSLSEQLKLFFNLRPALKDYYGKPKNNKNCALFGIDISF